MGKGRTTNLAARGYERNWGSVRRTIILKMQWRVEAPFFPLRVRKWSQASAGGAHSSELSEGAKGPE